MEDYLKTILILLGIFIIIPLLYSSFTYTQYETLKVKGL